MDSTGRIQPAVSRRLSTQAFFGALLAVALAASACGTRVDAPVRAGAGGSPAPPSAPGAADDTEAGAPAGAGGAPAGPTSEGSPASAPDTSASSELRTTAGASTGPPASARVPQKSPTTSPGALSRTTGGAAKQTDERTPQTALPRPPGAPYPQPSGRSPVVFANVGTHSGVGGATLYPVVQGVQVWVKMINASGGLNGHEVKLLLFDDGGDPARHRAQVQEAVERHGVIAFLGNTEVLTGRGTVAYLEQKRVPVVGTDTGEPWAYGSPMYFPQASSGDALNYTLVAGTADQTVPQGKNKLGTLVCFEAQICTDADRVFAEAAPGLGFEHVYRAKASLTQPDFTGECLAARNAGVQVFFMMLPTNTTQRAAASCIRQGFRPTFATSSVIAADRLKDDPNFDGLIAATQVFPWYQTGTPATDEYQQAMRTYGRDVAPGAAPAVGWVAGKLMERAGAALSEPPTSQSLLAGLWSIRGDTLGGITQPLTFVHDRPAAPVSCWFVVAIRNGAWQSPDGFRMHCR